MVETSERTDPDAIVIGSGFGGAVTACRLTEAGLRVLVLERGRRFGKEDFPVHPEADIPSTESEAGKRQPASPSTGYLLWAMNHGMWEVRDLGEILVAQAAGVGGGSLFYANVHLRPPAGAFEGWPEEYNKYKLDPYFDLAAYMLDVKPYSHGAPRLGKTTQLEATAEELGRGTHCFRPPLAVNFGRPLPEGVMEENRFGRKQGRCELRGECCFGCRAMAKNTLDLNYLAQAEDATREGKQLAQIDDLAEVLWIGPGDGEFYEVEYCSLDRNESHVVRARWVFLCAGAVNSTELLLKSRVEKQLPCPGPEDGLGEGFYPNADSIAVAFDCEGLQEADRGPTITSALLYQDEKHWFLFEDGGIPTDLEPFLGVFRSPLWLGRNRFWKDSRPTPSSRVPRIGYATLPLQSLGNTLPKVIPDAPPRPRPWRSPLLQEIAQGLVDIGRGLRSGEQLWGADKGGAPGGGEGDSQLIEALEATRDQLVESFVFVAEPLVAEAFERTGRTVEEQLALSEVVQKFPVTDGLDLSGMEKVELPARLLRLAVQLVWGSQGNMVRELVSQLLENAMNTGPGMVELATNLLRWALDFRMSDGHTGMLLCMGRDSDLPAKLSVEIPDPPPIGSTITDAKPGRELAPLRARFPAPRNPDQKPDWTTQQLILRDIVNEGWHGELRTDPISAFTRRRLTVHPQGGCPMDRVTKTDGEVIGCPGLYVMDAAAFPKSVGVNPSATILAVAEYKVERFIRKKLGKQYWRASQFSGSRGWSSNRWKKLDPLRQIQGESKPPLTAPVGIKFSETMEGSSHASAGSRPYLLDVKLDAEIDDLTRFLDRYDKGERPRIAVGGTVWLTSPTGTREQWKVSDEAESFIRLFREPVIAGAGGGGTRLIEYTLHLSQNRAPSYIIKGGKILQDEVGKFDLWDDVSNLEFTMEGAGAPFAKGSLKVSPAKFFGDQLRSFEATNTDDPVRQLWALTAFGKLFFGQLLDIYMPELKTLRAAAKCIVERAHV